MITLPKSEYEKILGEAQLRAPDEACGLIGGRVLDDGKEVVKAYILTNIDHSPEHFSLDPKEQLQAVKDMRAQGLVPSATGILIRPLHRAHPKRINGWPTTARPAI